MHPFLRRWLKENIHAKINFLMLKILGCEYFSEDSQIYLGAQRIYGGTTIFTNTAFYDPLRTQTVRSFKTF